MVNGGEGVSVGGFLCRLSLVFGGVRQGGDSDGRLWVCHRKMERDTEVA